MPTYQVQGPSGRTYTIEGPDGATAEELGAHVLSQSRDERIALQQQKDRALYDPAKDNSFLDNVVQGAGRGTASVGRALGLGSVLEHFGMPGTKDEAAQLDAPLMKTAGGKLGSVLGQVGTAAPLVLVPGANTYGGAALLGGAWGGASTEGGLADRALGAAEGAAGGAIGKGVGDALGYGASQLLARSAANAATKQAGNAGRDAALQAAQSAGYVIPPADATGGFVNTVLQGISGKAKTAQTASQKNQEVTNALVKSDFGLPPTFPITRDGLNAVRAKAGAAYDAVSNAGMVQPQQAYTDALDAISAPYVKASQGFPNAKPNPIISAVDELRTPQFDAGAGIAKISELRGSADAAMMRGDKQTGKAYGAAAKAIEDAIDAHLVSSGAPADLLKNYREARQTIAKTYTAEKALNPVTGDINAQVLGLRAMQGKPLSGGMAQVGDVAAAFPKATQMLKEVPNQVSPLDAAAALAAHAQAGGAGAAAVAVRPGIRSLILSKPYQSLMASPPTYGPSKALGLLDYTMNQRPELRDAFMLTGLGLLGANN